GEAPAPTPQAMGPTGTPAMGPTGTPAMGPTGTPAMGPTGTPTSEPSAPVAPVPASAAAIPSTPEAPADTSRRAILSPVVRRLAAEHNLDLDLVVGTGDGGRITRKDVERYVESGPATPAPQPAAVAEVEPISAPTPEPATPTAVAETPAPAEPPRVAEPSTSAPTKVTITTGVGDETEKLPRLRRRIAERMVHAKHTAAHVWTSVEVDYEQVERVRSAHRERFKAEEGFSLTYLPFIARATMDALSEYPVVNSAFDFEGGTRTFHRGVNLGIAIDLSEQGLIVATLRGADGLSMTGLARSIREKAAAARDGALGPDDISGTTFTITNPGPFGSFMSAPIINLPNVAILSTDTVKKRPTVVTMPDGSDTIAIRHIGYLGLTWDHRALDGSTATLFLNRIRTNLETWDWDQELR
ncbi:MAG: 2-oxo acid dehydrogenase subunit E2, partial [Actinomycetota bacterium]